MHTRSIYRLVVPVLLLAAAGCGGSGLYKATGRLTYKGQPVPSTWVIFQPDDKHKRASRGLTDDDGHFTVTHSKTEFGILPGKHTVILKYRVTAQEETHETPPKANKDLRAVIDRYNDPDKSPLHYEATKNGQVFDIELP